MYRYVFLLRSFEEIFSRGVKWTGLEVSSRSLRGRTKGTIFRRQGNNSPERLGSFNLPWAHPCSCHCYNSRWTGWRGPNLTNLNMKLTTVYDRNLHSYCLQQRRSRRSRKSGVPLSHSNEPHRILIEFAQKETLPWFSKIITWESTDRSSR